MAGDVIEDVRAYYAQRASQYERVYHKPERQADLRAMHAWLPAQFNGRRVPDAVGIQTLAADGALTA